MPLNSLIYTLRYCRAFTHSSSVFLQRKNIGEVARSDGGVDLIEGAESTGGGVKSRSSFVYHK